MTSLSGLVTYLELMHAAGLRSSIERHVGLRGGGQGWTDSQVVNSLILLNLAGGESVSDLDVLEKDAGFYRVLREVESYGMRRRERRALENRWRGERRRSVPSESAVFRYLEGFHNADEEASRQAHSIHTCTQPRLRGCIRWPALQSRSPRGEATLDMDATLRDAQGALYSYRKYPGFPESSSMGSPNSGSIVRSCKAQSPVYPIRDAFAVVEHPSCPSSSSSCPLPVG